MTSTATPKKTVKPVLFFGLALGWLAAAYLIGHMAPKMPFGFTVLSVLFLAVPIMLSGAYTGAIAQVRTLSAFHPRGWIFRLLSKRLLKTVLWGVWALITSFFVLLQFILYTPREWLALLLCIPLFWIVVSASQRVLVNEIKRPYLVTDFAIRWGRLITPVLMVILYVGMTALVDTTQNFGSLHDAIAAQRSGLPTELDSSLVQTGLQLITLSDGIKGYVFGKAALFNERIPLLLTAFGSYVVFLNACATLASFLIPAREYRRVFGAPSEDDVAPPLTNSRIGWASALMTLGILFVYVPLFADLETRSRENPAPIEAIKKVELAVEQIDNYYYAPGTSQQLRAAQYEVIRALDISRVRLESQIDRAFDQMENNVDRYLDWYYSLGAEYMRLAKLLTGDLEGYLSENLTKHLQSEELMRPITLAFDSHLQEAQAIKASLETRKREILERNRIVVDQQPIKVIQRNTLADLVSLPTSTDAITLRQRAAAGGIGAGLGAALVTKIVSKGTLKTAAKAITKAAASKVTAGGVTGAAIGSFIPAVGTGVGFALGVIGGIAGGVLFDKAALSLEEHLSREEFRQELVASIRSKRDEVKAILLPPTPAV